MKVLRTLLWLVAMTAALSVSAQHQEPTDSVYTIVEAINSVDGAITVIQPMELDRVVQHVDGKRRSSQQADARVGYRVQVFSDNNLRSARANAEARKRLAESAVPGVNGYLTFVSPYWRVRMGDFSSYSEAESYMLRLKAALPQFADDIRIVRERVNASR